MLNPYLHAWASSPERLAIAATVTLGFALLARALRGVNGSGALAGGLACFLLFAGAGPTAFAALAARAKLVRTWGDCYGYLLVATGWADVMCDPILSPWDIAALIPVIRGAGGAISDWQGRDPVGAQSIVAAATPELHATVIAALNP